MYCVDICTTYSTPLVSKYGVSLLHGVFVFLGGLGLPILRPSMVIPIQVVRLTVSGLVKIKRYLIKW